MIEHITFLSKATTEKLDKNWTHSDVFLLFLLLYITYDDGYNLFLSVILSLNTSIDENVCRG